MATIDKWAAAKRRPLSPQQKIAVIASTFLDMLMGRKEQSHGYLGTLHAPIGYPTFFLLVLIAVSLFFIFVFGART